MSNNFAAEYDDRIVVTPSRRNRSSENDNFDRSAAVVSHLPSDDIGKAGPRPFSSLEAYRTRVQSVSAAAKKHEERLSASLAELIKSTNDDMARTRTETFIFVGALAFVAVTIVSITDKILLLGSRTKLPLLDVTAGIDDFLLGAPLVLLAAHFALLLKFNALRSKCLEISARLRDLSEVNQETATSLSFLVGTNFLAQWLAGVETDRFFRKLNLIIYIIVIGIAPLVVLLSVILRTLPLHRWDLTAIQLLVLLITVWLLVYFHSADASRLRRAWIVAISSWAVATVFFAIPDSYPDSIGASILPASIPSANEGVPSRRAFALTAFLLEGGIDPATRRPIFWSRNLIVLDDSTLWRTDEVTPQETRGNTQAPSSELNSNARPTIRLRGRNLRYATLARSDLRGADFTLSDLSGANFEGANLRGARFGCAASKSPWVQRSLQDKCTLLTDARFELTDLRGARFVGLYGSKPSLATVNFRSANLDGVDLSFIDLKGADLVRASLIGANLSNAILVGASLTGANLTAADMRGADLGLTALNHSLLDGASLKGARIVAANLSNASLITADFSESTLTASQFREAYTWFTIPPSKENAAWVDFTDIRVMTPSDIDIRRMRNSLLRLDSYDSTAQSRPALLHGFLDGTHNPVDADANDIWIAWAKFLQRSDTDPSYRTALAKIVGDWGCIFPDYAEAVLRWVSPRWYTTGYRYKPPLSPSPPIDNALNEAPEYKPKGDQFDQSDGWVEIYPDVQSPVPEWLDLSPLVSGLKSHECHVAHPRLIEALAEAAHRRAQLPDKNGQAP